MCQTAEGQGEKWRPVEQQSELQQVRSNTEGWSCRGQQIGGPGSGWGLPKHSNNMDPAGSGEFVVGCRLAIKTTLGDDFEGLVLTYDKSSNIVVLQESGSSGPRRNLRFLKANYIKDFTLLGQVEEPLDLKTPFLDISSLRSREEAAIRQAEADAERIGVGVTQEAQDIFDALSKTLPVRWEKTSILVMNEVRVNIPYLPENVTGGLPAANERVRKVLELERKRLLARGTS